MWNISQSNLETVDQADNFISDEVKEWFIIVHDFFLVGAVSLFGIATNTVNIIVFKRQGFSDAINVSLLGLTLADLCALMFVLWSSVLANPFLKDWKVLNLEVTSLLYYTVGAPRLYFTHIAHWITVFITVQRSLCIAKPHKVKCIISACRAGIYVGAIYILFLFVFIVALIWDGFTYLGWKFIPERNITLTDLILDSGLQKKELIIHYLLGNLNVVYFVIITASTAILVFLVIRTAKIRESMFMHGRIKESKCIRFSKHEHRVTVMVSVLASTVIAAIIPPTVCIVLGIFVTGFNINQEMSNLCFVVWKLALLFQSLNSSVSIVIYYKTSTKYRSTLYEFLGR